MLIVKVFSRSQTDGGIHLGHSENMPDTDQPHLVPIGCSAGAGQQQGESGALELLTHLPQEMSEGTTWRTFNKAQRLQQKIPQEHTAGIHIKYLDNYGV